MAFTKFTATFTNGSSVATNVVLLRGTLAYFARGTRIVVSSDPVLAEIEAIAAPSNSEITLADTWDFDTGVYTCTANMTSEGVRDAVQKIREYISRIQAGQAALIRLYDSTADGLAGTVSGEYFNVITPSDPDVYSQLYLNDLGVAVLQGEMPTSLAIEAAQAATELSEDAAAASEAAAANSATVASTKATEASDSAAEALASEIAAQAAQAATEQIFDQFGDQYLGAKASDPTVDNDGDPLTEGDIYFNTTDNVLKFYTGAAWVAPEDIATSAAAAALASQQAAAVSESAAATSETNAATSESNAATSEANAAASATAASGSASDAAASEAAALASEQAAATSETNAATSEANAASSSTLASSFANAAQTSATSASISADAASDSATAASTSETNAAASATASAASATDSANSASAASASASNAATSATNAATSASQASASATAASASASAASVSETNASNSESAAAASEANASNSESAAAVSEANAASSASAALSSETAASSSATVAAGSATTAVAASTAAEGHSDDALASANAASVSATNASDSATSAASSASAASASASAASDSEDAALASEQAAALSESNAATSASQSASSATAASASASAAATSEANASASETNAENSATSAASSATAAAGSATSASDSAATALLYLNDTEAARDEVLQYSTAVSRGLVFVGVYDASTGVYPSLPVDVIGNPFWIIETGGTISGTVYQAGDSLIRDVENEEWIKLDTVDQVSSVAGKVGAVVLDRADVGLSNVDNTSDLNKPVSTATQSALDGKSNVGHTHAISDVTSLQSALDGKAAVSHSHVIGDVSGLQTALDGKAAVSHTHSIANVTGLQGALDGKAPLTGGGTSGTWPISVTGNAATISGQANSATITASTGVDANNIVRRDGNGYIYANHINFSTSESENPSISSFITSNGDGWSRKSSLAHVKNQIRNVADGTWSINITGNAASASSVAWGNVSSKPSNIMYYQGFTLNADTMDSNSTGFTYSVGAPATGPVARFSTGGGYDLWLNAGYSGGGNTLYFRTRNGDAGSLNSWKALVSYGVNYGDSLYGTIMYDSNNTGYYCDPSSASVLSDVRADIFRDTASTSYYLNAESGQWRINTPSGASGFGPQNTAYNHITTDRPRHYMDKPLEAESYVKVYGGSSEMNASDVRAPIFYDSNNTGYYVDPASTSNLDQLQLQSSSPLRFGTTSTALLEHYSDSTPVAFAVRKGGNLFTDGANYAVLNLQRTNHNNSATTAGASLFFELKDSGGTLREYAGVTGRKTTAGTGGGQLDFHNYGRNVVASMNADLFLHGASVRAPIFYDSNNTGYYCDPNNTSNFYAITSNSESKFSAAGYTDPDPGVVRAIKVGSNGIAVNGSSKFNGDLTATGNVTAYSDINLKDNIKVISNAVEKVSQCRGVTYTRKDQDDKEKRHAGVIAQEVEAVLPEVVQINEAGIKSVAYGNMVGLLIEAIKEQQTQIEALTSEINTLKEMIK